MTKAEEILERVAKKNMVQWNQESFKITHNKLHKTIIEAINEALNLHNIIAESKQFDCRDCRYFEGITYHDKMYCRDCRQMERFTSK